MGQKSGNILCVDDEPGILRALKWVLKKKYNVATAEGGQEALELVRANDFDVIISDQRMPGMMGCEFLREAKQIHPRAMRILLTGYSDLQAIISSVNEGEVFRFLNKPWQIPELLRIVGEAMDIAKSPASAPISAEPQDRVAEGAGKLGVMVLDEDPETATLVKSALGLDYHYYIVNNLADAVAAMEMPNIGLVISEMHLGGSDISRLLKVMKSRAPEIVTIVLSERSDADDVVSLINEGQVYRFLFKPAKLGYMKLLTKSALNKHLELKRNPEIANRHRVERMSEEAKATLMRDIQQAAPAADSSAGEVHGGGVMQRFASGFRRLFGT